MSLVVQRSASGVSGHIELTVIDDIRDRRVPDSNDAFCVDVMKHRAGCEQITKSFDLNVAEANAVHR